MIKKTLITSALVALLASNTTIASQEADELRQIIAEQQKVLALLENA